MSEEKECIIEIDIECLKNFKDHPYKVEADLQMMELKETKADYRVP